MAESAVTDILNHYNNLFAGVFYVVPIMSFSILVGLAMDYDIFLMFRVSASYSLLIFVSASLPIQSLLGISYYLSASYLMDKYASFLFT